MTEQGPRPSILVIIPPPIWALAFILLGWGAGAVMGFDASLKHATIGIVVLIIGIAIAGSGRFAFARAGTEVIPVSKKNSVLVVSGPFKFTRNPMYLGMLVAMTGLAIVIGTVSVLVSVIVYFLFVNFISIPYEEAKMERQFGDDYRAYKRRVRRWI